MSSFIQVVISQKEQQLLCGVEKWITLSKKEKKQAFIDLIKRVMAIPIFPLTPR